MNGEKKKERQAQSWTAPVRGAAVSLGTYLLGTAALAWFVTTGAMGEDGAGAALMVLAAVSALLGGLWAADRSAKIPNAVAVAALFALVLAAAGLACWRQIGSGGGVLLGCIAGGGVLAELLKGRRGKGKKARRRSW